MASKFHWIEADKFIAFLDSLHIKYFYYNRVLPAASPFLQWKELFHERSKVDIKNITVSSKKCYILLSRLARHTTKISHALSVTSNFFNTYRSDLAANANMENKLIMEARNLLREGITGIMEEIYKEDNKVFYDTEKLIKEFGPNFKY